MTHGWGRRARKSELTGTPWPPAPHRATSWRKAVPFSCRFTPWLRLELEGELRETFRLAEASVCCAHGDPQAEREAAAQRSARYLE
jgi:hypothetical protein